jgi:amino acid transporter
MFVIGLSFFFPQFSKSMWCYASIIGIFGILNGFGVKSSKSINNFLAILKMVIMIGLPLLACFLLPFDQPIDCGNGPIMELLNWRDISKCMFITLWAFVGIESIMMDSNESPKRIRSGMMNGIVLCTLIYVFNSYVLMRNVPSLGTVAVGDFNLFNMIFPNQDWIFPIILMVILTGSLHGWTYTAISTCEMGNRLFPRLFKSKLTNLIGVSVIPFLVIVILKFWLKREDALNLVFELSTFVLLIICAVAIFSFYKACFARKISDNLHVFKSRSQTISDIIYICIATIYVGLSLYASLDLILNQAL